MGSDPPLWWWLGYTYSGLGPLPTNYEEAMMSLDFDKWLEAMKSEIGSMYENKVWTLVDLPDDRQAIQNNWIFKKKTDADGNVTIYKARLVAKGF